MIDSDVARSSMVDIRYQISDAWCIKEGVEVVGAMATLIVAEHLV